jgi:hypothetical protein
MTVTEDTSEENRIQRHVWLIESKKFDLKLYARFDQGDRAARFVYFAKAPQKNKKDKDK